MLEHELPQQVILLCAGFGQSTIAKAEVAIRIQASRDAQGVRRQLTLEAILTNDVKQGLDAWRKKETAVPELMKLPVAACVLRCKSLGHGEDGWLQLDHVAYAK